VESAPVLTSASIAYNTSSLTLVASLASPSTSLSVISVINQISVLSNIEESNHDGSSTVALVPASYTAPVEDENVDLVDVQDEV